VALPPPDGPPPARRVRFRLLPWRLRRRVKGLNDDLGVPGSLFDDVDDPVAAAIGLVVLVVVLLGMVPLVLGLVLLPFELALIAAVALGELLLRAVHLRPWTLAVEDRVGDRWIPVERVQVKGFAAARRERAARQSAPG